MNVERLNLGDNEISDYGLHSIKNILNHNYELKSINLASNMISGDGLELLLTELIEHQNL